MGTLIEPVIVDDVVYNVEYTYTPPVLQTRVNPYEPAEVEIISITMGNSAVDISTLSPAIVEEILDYLIDYHENMQGDAYFREWMDDYLDSDTDDWEDE
jgi:hypothetical protein